MKKKKKKTPDLVFEPETPIVKHTNFSCSTSTTQRKFSFDCDETPTTVETSFGGDSKVTVRSFKDLVFNEDNSATPVAKSNILKGDYKLGEEVWVFDRIMARHITGRIAGTHPRQRQYLVVNERDKFKQWCSSDPVQTVQYKIVNRVVPTHQ